MKQEKQDYRPTNDHELPNKQIVDLLAAILADVKKQVTSQTPPPLSGEAQAAVRQFDELRAAMKLFTPIIRLTASPDSIVKGEQTTLSWSSIDAQSVSIEPAIGNVTPVEGGSIQVKPDATTTYTATARLFDGSQKASVTVTVKPNK